MQGNASKMIIQFKMNIKRCPKYTGYEFKKDLSRVAAAIKTRTAPSNIEPDTPTKDTGEAVIVTWKENYGK
jgi:hypothetical protein